MCVEVKIRSSVVSDFKNLQKFKGMVPVTVPSSCDAVYHQDSWFTLTPLPLDKMAAILQMIFLDAF